ncbi:MAG: polymorphic toxin-type HINT domain-containing protein [Acutalibacteraceae bacterium]|nr:polymorphic toxin-type HINT domain-containing protein [Acutalibacteraceae bacterium]
MATISLYASKINNMPGLINEVKKSVTNYKSELTNLRNKSLQVNKSICDLDDVISTISTSTQTQEDKIEALDNFHDNCDQFITVVMKIDDNVADVVNKNKEDFYNKYYYLKPECEKSGWEKFCDGCKKVGQWCKDNWKSIVKIIVAVVIIVALGVASVLTGGALAVILAGAFWGALMGGLLGGVMGGITSVISGGSFLEGFADGMLSGTITGAITGAATAGLGLAGQAFGKVVECGSKLGNAVKITSKVTQVLSTCMDGFDTLSMAISLFDPDNPIVQFNQKLHSSVAYNIFQGGVNALAIFTGAATTTMKCFVAGTMILTAGGLLAIENIKVGNRVISTNPETLEVAEKTVVETYVRETTELVQLTINGEVIKTTPDHPFYVKDVGFVGAGDLYIGDKLLDSKGNILLVEDIKLETTETPVPVYNFQVEDFHTYHVGENGIWVHNADCKVHPNGEIEITDWSGYPESGPRPEGKLKLIDGEEYLSAKKAKNAANRKYHRQHPECKGMDIHEVHPVKFAGSPTDVSNKIPLNPKEHSKYTSFWATIKAIALRSR